MTQYDLFPGIIQGYWCKSCPTMQSKLKTSLSPCFIVFLHLICHHISFFPVTLISCSRFHQKFPVSPSHDPIAPDCVILAVNSFSMSSAPLRQPQCFSLCPAFSRETLRIFTFQKNIYLTNKNVHLTIKERV